MNFSWRVWIATDTTSAADDLLLKQRQDDVLVGPIGFTIAVDIAYLDVNGLAP